MTTFLIRVASGVGILVVCVGLILVGGWGVTLLAAVLAALLLWEFRGLSDKMGYRAPSWLLYPLGLYITFSGTYLRGIQLEAVLSLALIGGLLTFLFLPGRREGLGRWAMGTAGSLYIGLPLNSYLQMYFSGRHGTAWVLLVVIAAVMTDVLGLLVGSNLGRTPFFQRISPRKTVEGALAGLIGSLVVMIGGATLVDLPFAHAVALGILVGIGAVGGDLVESQMKRIAEVKDSSNLIPGHGGALDRFDSILFPAILVFYYASFGHLFH